MWAQADATKHEAMVQACLARLVAVVSDGGGNVCAAARQLVGGLRGDLAPRARICASHTLQLFLKYFW